MEITERILKKSSEMFLSFGIRNITMDNIAAELGMSKRTLYEHFGDKDNLVIECIKHMITEDNKELVDIIDNSDNVIHAMMLIMKRQEQRMKEFPKVFIEDIKKYYAKVTSSFYSCRENLKQFSASYTLLNKGMKQGIFRKDIKTELVDTFVHELISMLHNSERMNALNPTPAEVFHSIILPYFRGISTPEGLVLLDQYFENQIEQ